MTEQTRTFVGTHPETGERLLVTIFEDADTPCRIVGMEVATRDPEQGSRGRWSAPAQMVEET